MDEPVCISHSANILVEGMNPAILPTAIDKQLSSLGSLAFVWQPVLEKKKWIQKC